MQGAHTTPGTSTAEVLWLLGFPRGCRVSCWGCKLGTWGLSAIQKPPDLEFGGHVHPFLLPCKQKPTLDTMGTLKFRRCTAGDPPLQHGGTRLRRRGSGIDS